jgi:glycosyltransferase involved in cell wall biosynthesis
VDLEVHVQLGMRFPMPSAPIRVGVFDDCESGLGGAQLVVAHLAASFARSCRVDLISTGNAYNRKTLGECFGVDLAKVQERTIVHEPSSFGCLGIRPTIREIGRAWDLTHSYDLFIYSGIGVPPYCFAKNGLVYCHFPFQHPPASALRQDPLWRNRNSIDRHIRRIGYDWLWGIRFRRYRKLLANSSYTADWIQRRWGKCSEVVFPPVEPTIPIVPKRNIIASVGRFSASASNGKNQLEQVSAFGEFLREAKSDWKMIIMGAYHLPVNRAYFEKVRKAGKALPIEFLENPRRSVVCHALAEARLFWHTAGLSVDEARHPESAEHFGIATVEAMRAGCVPIVIGSGGQREIVEDGRSGYVCADMRELVQKTIAVSRDESLMAARGAQAKQRSMAFGRETFERRVNTIATELLGRVGDAAEEGAKREAENESTLLSVERSSE